MYFMDTRLVRDMKLSSFNEVTAKILFVKIMLSATCSLITVKVHGKWKWALYNWTHQAWYNLLAPRFDIIFYKEETHHQVIVESNATLWWKIGCQVTKVGLFLSHFLKYLHILYGTAWVALVKNVLLESDLSQKLSRLSSYRSDSRYSL